MRIFLNLFGQVLKYASAAPASIPSTVEVGLFVVLAALMIFKKRKKEKRKKTVSVKHLYIYCLWSCYKQAVLASVCA